MGPMKAALRYASRATAPSHAFGLALAICLASLLTSAGIVDAQGPTLPPTSPSTPPAPPAPTVVAQPNITADALLGFLQREAARGGGACALSTTYRIGNRLMIACGPTGVWIAQIDDSGGLTLVMRQMLGASVVRLFEGGGRMWAELQGGAAVPVDPNGGPTAAPPVTQTPSATPTPSSVPALPTDPALPPLPSNNQPWAGTQPTRAPRIGGMWEVNTMLRPFLALETLGGGVLMDLSVGYRLNAPVHLWASLQPLGLATGKDGGMTPFVALMLASYDTRNFELGLGFGGQKVNNPGGFTDVDANAVGPGTGITIAQFARMGDRDGLMITIRSDIVLFRSKFELSNVVVQGQLPLRGEQGLWVIATGGGGTTGYALGEIGLRSRLKGDGGPGSVFLNVTIGGTSLFFEEAKSDSSGVITEVRSPDYSGPLLGIGADWRI